MKLNMTYKMCVFYVINDYYLSKKSDYSKILFSRNLHFGVNSQERNFANPKSKIVFVNRTV